MKKLIFRFFLLYKRRFPIDKGKSFVARMLTKVFGSFNITNSKGLILEVFPNSMMDLSYFEVSNNSHDYTIQEIENLNEGDVFIDIGANIGYFSLLASKKVGISGKIFAFEPSYREYRRLIGNILSNSNHNILAYNVALGNFSGQISLSVEPNHTGLNKINVNESHKNEIIIPIFKFEDIYLFKKKISLIKIDVEGAEYQVLEGMRSLLEEKIVNNVVVEITPSFLKEFGNTKMEIYSLMENYGYKPSFNLDIWQYDEIFKVKG